MIRSRARWWGIYAGCAVAVVAALLWVSHTVLELERREIAAQAEARSQELLRLSLWRLDSWMLPLLTRESSRPFQEYESAGEGSPPSPLGAVDSPYIVQYFQMEEDGTIQSPQACGDGSADGGERGRTLLWLQDQVVHRDLRRRVEGAESRDDALLQEVPLTPASRSSNDYAARIRGVSKVRQDAQVDLLNQCAVMGAEDVLTVGSLVFLWWGAEERLLGCRRVSWAGRELLQGMVFDWPMLRAGLLAEIQDLLPAADLVPWRASRPGEQGLTSLPAELILPVAEGEARIGLTPARATLMLAWLAVALALAAAGVTLRSSIAFGERRQRFASAVTHELRTPLTTFRLYSEMLADNVVRDPQQRQSYLETLQRESGRLAMLVENVLSYARLEERRDFAHRRLMSAAELVAAVRPRLRELVEAAGMAWSERCGALDRHRVSTDPEVVLQVLTNLVDNACKYANRGDKAEVSMAADVAADRLEIRVRDRGPGLPEGSRRRLFQPFERGVAAEDRTPGVGLGLALARGLARDLGGDLRSEPEAGAGACFLLSLPLAG